MSQSSNTSIRYDLTSLIFLDLYRNIPCSIFATQTRVRALHYTGPMPGASDLDLLVRWTMPYGKYKGRRLAELPGHYLSWFARSGFPDDELGRLLALMHEIDHNGLRPLLGPLLNRNPGP